MADAITTKNITSVDEVQSVDNTDKVFVNDNGSFKQISVSNLMKQAPSGVTEETDPTVSEWAKQPTKPSYTANEVGALPVGTKIPTKTSDLTNDSGYLTQIPEEYVTETELGQKGYVIEDDIPEKLPSPGILTFTGAVNDTYDGSANKTINIPTGGGEGGTSDYNALANKPKLNGVEIVGNKTSTDYKIVSSEQGIENNGKFLGVGADGNVTPVDKPTYTADEVGARPDTWTPSAEDVGALPNNTEIPSKTSDLENDSGFITNSDIPKKLPNPQKIIFTGAVTAEYDGSSQQTINIPTGGGSDPYTLPIMSDTQLGGGKAVEKTDEDVPVAVDPSTGQLFVPTYPENTGGGGGTVDPEQIKQAVNGYLEENPVSGMTAEQEQQLNQNTEDISSLSEEKLNKNQGISNSGKYLVVGADGNITFSDESTDSPEKPLGDYNYSLPDGYKKVDYIDSKGTLHYFLDWTPTVNSRMVQKVIPVEGANTFIGFAADNNLSFGYQISVSGGKVLTYLGDSFGNSASEKSFELDYKQYITIDIANGSQKVECLEIGTKTSIFDVYESWNNKYPIVGGTFQTWYASGSAIALARHKLVRCQIYESEELVYDFVPALRDTDNVCGLYDLVNSTFAPGRTNNNYTQSYDYGEIIDDTGGQNGENAENTENTHIIVSEMTGDAIQDAINQCKSSGGGVIELLPGGVYICDSPLTIYTDRVDIIGNGAKLDFSGISSDIVCVTLQSSGDISDYSEMIREEYLHYIRGVYFVGPNRTANYEGGRIGTALVFTGTETKISTAYTVDNCVIAGFKTGVDLFTNSWCAKFSNCDISVCDTGIQMISGGQNYGEKFTFISCTIHTCSVGAVCNHNAGTLQFLGCSMDYNFCAFKTDNQAHIIFTGGHIENNKDKNYFCICSNFGIVLIANSVLHGSQTQYGFASVSEAGKVIMSNCMKELWTMGEDEKDDNGNSKIIYDWINFAS